MLRSILLAVPASAACVAAVAGARGAAPTDTIVFARPWQEATYTVGLAGSGERRVTGAYGLVWSRDGRKVAGFFVKGRSCVIAVYDFRTKTRTQIAPTCRSVGLAAWSPDGTRVAYTTRNSGEDIAVVPVAAPAKRVVITSGPAPDQHPSWSPKGAPILFDAVDLAGDGTVQIYAVEPSGSGLRRVTTASSPADQNRDAEWSPDGTQIAFSSSRDEGNTLYSGEIYVMQADGSNVRRLTNSPGWDAQPSWSPDGTRIVFVSARGGNPKRPDVYVMNADGSGQTKVASGGWSPRWLPPGASTTIP